MREIVFDTETTGLDFEEDRIIEVGGVELWNHIPTGKEYHWFVRPAGRRVDPAAFDIHGISDDFLKDKPLFGEIVEEFAAAFDGAVLIAHNAAFDIRFLNAELARLGRPAILPGLVIDTLPMARRKFPMAPATLDALCSRFQIDTTKRDKHGALVDSALLAQVYIELIGGRQSALRLVAAGEEDDRAADLGGHRAARRPQALPSRISPDEDAAHRRFVEGLGEAALWRAHLPEQGG